MTPTRMTFIIDADPIRYRVGFSVEKSSYELITEAKDGTMHKHLFDRTEKKGAGDQVREFIEQNPQLEVLEKIKHVEVGPVEHAMQALRVQIDSIIKECREHFKLDRRDYTSQLILSGKSNYRDRLATIKEYKGNRDPTHKPTHYAALTTSMIADYGAVVINGREADDECSIRAWDLIRTDRPHGFVIATIDKDLDQIPGWHYDYMKKVFYLVHLTDADHWFWAQTLSGDTTDNVGGCWKIGVKRAESIVEDIDRDCGRKTGVLFDSCAWHEIVSVYQQSLHVPGCPYTDAHAAALENARLVYLQRTANELWTPAGHPKEFVKSENIDD